MSRWTQQKQSVVDSCIQLADRGYLAGIGGNVALRLDVEHFAVTPSAADYYTMRADDICVLRLDTLAQLEGDLKPSVERGLHAALLRFHPECQASIHTHQPLASAVSLLDMSLPLTSAEDRAALGDKAILVPYAPSGTNLLVHALTKRLRVGSLAYLMRNHGVICAAGSLQEGRHLVSRIELAAATFLRDAIDRQTQLIPPLAALVHQALGTAIAAGN